MRSLLRTLLAFALMSSQVVYSHENQQERPDVAESDVGSVAPSVGPHEPVDDDLDDDVDDDSGRREEEVNPDLDVPGLNVKINGLESSGGPAGVTLAEDYDVVAIINKAADVQTLEVHRFYTDPNTNRRVALGKETFKISTGQEEWICTDRKDGKPGLTNVWTGTPSGFYNPSSIHADHHSRAYDDATMYHAVFFNKGIATHQGQISYKDKQSGQEFRLPRASHGCVRMSKEGSSAMMKYVLQSGLKVDPNASNMFRSECPSSMNDAQWNKCNRNASAREAGYKALAAEAMVPRPGLNGPYSQKPEVPNLSRSGNLNRNNPKRESDFRALYIVQCVDRNGQDCSTTKDSPQYRQKKDCGNPENYVPPQPQQVSFNPSQVINKIGSSVQNVIGQIFGGSPQQRAPPRGIQPERPRPRRQQTPPPQQFPNPFKGFF